MESQSQSITYQNTDLISHLPENLIHNILSFLPLRSIVATSTLSKYWVHIWKPLWIYNTRIDFNEEFTTSMKKNQYVQALNKLLDLHIQQKIKIFRHFFCPRDRYSSHLSRWIEFATQKQVEHLHLDMSGRVNHLESPDDDHRWWWIEKFRMPNCIFYCQSLSSLYLSCCILNPPQDFKGLRSLKEVVLEGVSIQGEKLSQVISGSPLLERLCISYCDSMGSVKLEHPRLKRLTFENCLDVEEVELRTPNLRNFQFVGGVSDKPNFRDISSLDDASLMLRTPDEADFQSLVWDNFMSKLSLVRSLAVVVRSTHPAAGKRRSRSMFWCFKERRLSSLAAGSVYHFFLV
ncbi:hypothetical protein H6P81_020627 [Aristolochia fimbriata]|uniref:F-box domain-containing protein n=1 Tax=Aristolochia fimbriata TaxID=158543 RepID=A0AAV7DY62_ARIFI|nr:hypothetical protein H6P81_020627 [Aristolochia fimbriata]